MGGREGMAVIPPLLAPPPPHRGNSNNPNDPGSLFLELDEGDVLWPQTTSISTSNSNSNSHPHTHTLPSSSSSSSFSSSPPPFPLPLSSLPSETPTPSASPSPSPRPKPGLGLGLSAALSPDSLPFTPRRAVAVPSIHSSSNDHRPFLAGASRPLQMSAPVNVPVWPGGQRLPRERRPMMWDLQEGEEIAKGKEEVEVEEDDDTMLPPHILAARSRATSFSVFEGVGRTLKGRDLRQVRNAVLQKTGFLD